MTENKTKHQEKIKYSDKFDFDLTKQFVKMEKDANNQKIDKKMCKM